MIVEEGKRPETINPSYVECPKCHEVHDMWKTAANCKSDYITFICKCGFSKKMWCEPDGVIVDER